MPTVKFTVKIPKHSDYSKFILDEVARSHKTEVKRDLVGYFQLITGDWSPKNQPKLLKLTETFQDGIVTTVKPIGINAKIWTFVTLGTIAHPIYPRRAKFLRFMWGGFGSYIPKTRPGAQYGGPGIVKNGTMRYRDKKGVKHPGSEGRFFEKMIVKEYGPKYRRTMQNAVARGLKRARA